MSHIIPYLWFEHQAEEAVKFYVSIFNDSRIDNISRYGEAGPGPEGSAMVVEFQLNGQDFLALNATVPAGTEGQAPIAMFVSCDTQDEVDVVWEKRKICTTSASIPRCAATSRSVTMNPAT